MELTPTRIIRRTGASSGRPTGVVGPSGTASGGSSSQGVADKAREAEHALRADLADMATEAGHALHADEAAHAAAAHDLDSDSPVRDLFLSRVAPDTAAGRITFDNGLTTLADMLFGEFIAGLYAGKGGRIDAAGNAEIQSLRVRGSMMVQELIINRLQAIGGDQIFTESDIIDSAEDMGGNCWRLTLRKLSDDYFTAFTPGAVVKGMINTLGQGGGTFYTSWMRVNSVNQQQNSIEVSLYPVEQTPEGAGHTYAPGDPVSYCPPPCPLMRLARWGHQSDTTRQRAFYISSTDGQLVRYEGVTKPIIDPRNMATVIGRLPQFVLDMLPPNFAGDEGIYTKVVAAQNFMEVDYQGRPLPKYVDRGPWDPTASYFAGDTPLPGSGVYEISRAWHAGCLWQCARTGTAAAPAWNSTDWVFIQGDPSFVLEFRGAPLAVNPASFRFTLTLLARLHGADVTADILPADIEWTRYSEHTDGTQRVSSDNAWAVRRAPDSGVSMTFTEADLDTAPGAAPPIVEFRCTATIRDGLTGLAAATATITQPIYI